MAERLEVEMQGHVAIVRLNRPQKRNAIDIEMFEAIIEVGSRLASDATVRAVVLTGAGDHFCAGIDVAAFRGGGISVAGSGRMDATDDSPANFFQKAAFAWRELPVPVIAAIQGVAFGGGLQIALGADIRFATANAQLSIMEIKWGLVPDMAISATAHHLMPVDRAKELAYTGRVISGSEARTAGLITEVKEDPFAAAMELAGEIAARSPQAIRAIKKLFDESWHPHTGESLRLEARLQTSLMGDPNQLEAVQANLQKRKPDFCDGGA
jgi:enoyl-CoA hydratase/carnithine racemase